MAVTDLATRPAFSQLAMHRLAQFQTPPLECTPESPQGLPKDSVSPTVIGTRLQMAYEGVAQGENGPVRTDVHVPNASVVKTTEDYTRFVRILEKKYPNADGLDLNRAVRQHFYANDGARNQMPIFDSWLGTHGGRSLASLEGIEKDLKGLPHVITRPDGKSVNLAHLAVGIDTHYDIKRGEASRHSPLQWIRGAALTHGGDFGQTFGGVIRSIPGVGEENETLKKAFGYSSMDQLRGNQHGIEMGASMHSGQRLSTALQNHF